MARPRGDASNLIKRLEAALTVAKPRDVVDTTVMSKIVGMTWRNLLVTHIEPDAAFPVKRRGAEGVAWEFQVVKVLRHMIRRARERMATNEAAARRAHQLTSFSVPEDPEGPMSLADLAKLADLTIRAQNEKTRQREYVPAARVRDFLIRYNAAVTGGILGISQVTDPNGGMDPAARAVIDNELRNVAVHVGGIVDAFLKELGAGLQ
ncbi:hypothetical protein SAMIE_1015390 [Sphingobium amiense]|uniref:Uncharacterized protein n=1 Tax=Sphingobium amiense TaxID=135719 RepID=A0A494W4E3_9SPHN|nr:hypothetical protein [Sphingobium amiense]BBD98038.1 hypothetical protein SAMIE_1015390 [Sphingobium amiense]